MHPYKSKSESCEKSKMRSMGGKCPTGTEKAVARAEVKSHEARMHKDGGRTGHPSAYVPKTAREPTTSSWADVPKYARGGGTGHKYPKMTAGAESGVGRLQKAHKY